MVTMTVTLSYEEHVMMRKWATVVQNLMYVKTNSVVHLIREIRPGIHVVRPICGVSFLSK